MHRRPFAPFCGVKHEPEDGEPQARLMSTKHYYLMAEGLQFHATGELKRFAVAMMLYGATLKR